MALNPELVLPRVWHAAVQDLELSEAESEAYVRLRSRVQDVQGVEHDDEGGKTVPYHRILGYPNETVGVMPSQCVALHHGEGSAEPETAWRLLAQVSVGASRRRYFWILEKDLEAGRLADLVTFMR